MKERVSNKAFAKIMKESCNGEYSILEFCDFLEIFTRNVEKLVSEGKEVHLYDFGSFKPKSNPARLIKSKLGDIQTEGSRTLKFNASTAMQTRIKSKGVK